MPCYEVLVLLGSNIDPRTNIVQARTALDHHFTVLRESNIMHTPAVDVCVGQADFMNLGCLITTNLQISECRKILKDIEIQLGRPHHHQHNAPRVIDLDIVLWQKEIIDSALLAYDFLRQIIRTIYSDFHFS